MPGPCAVLLDLAARHATGALLRDSGTLYLADGAVVHAESPAAPGVGTLLTVGGRLTDDHWRGAIDRAGALRQVGRFLVDSGRLSCGELEICHLSALFDASYFVLAAARGGPTRFRPGAQHWFGRLRPITAGAVERESRRRTALLNGLWPHPQVDTTPVVRRTAPHSPAPSRRQRAVLGLADGVRTPSDIARLLGRPAFHTLVDIRRLAAAGHIDTPALAPPSPPVTPLVPWSADAAAVPDIALLRRIRDALEARL
ncbi:transcriptional regulator [Streptomyces sp. NPDC052396]|uniref:transcriptional regulator n=1 Tax=Streptomyces sp. NPDC052396 TaxID=3365689 RepID=UPI0037CE023E